MCASAVPYIQPALVNGARRAIRKKSIIEPLSKDDRMEVNAAITFQGIQNETRRYEISTRLILCFGTLGLLIALVGAVAQMATSANSLESQAQDLVQGVAVFKLDAADGQRIAPPQTLRGSRRLL